MQTAPAFRLSVVPFGSGRDPLALTLHVHCVVGPEPVEIGTKGQPLKPAPTITLPELVAEVERLASDLSMANTQPEPVSWPVVNGRLIVPEKAT